MSKDAYEDLDFTSAEAPTAAPDAEAIANAKHEARTGSPQLAKSGFYVAMARNAAGRIPPRGGERHCILVVEDDQALANLVSEVLATAGMMTRFAHNRVEINSE